MKKLLQVFLALSFVLWGHPVLSQDTPQYKSAKEIPYSVFAQLPRIEQVKISPNGENLAILYPINGETKFVIFDVRKEPTREPLIIDIGKGGVEWLEWVNNDRLLVKDESTWTNITASWITLFINSGEGLVAFDKTGDNITKLIPQKYFARPGNRFSLLDFLPDDPDHVLIERTDEESGMTAVYKLNVYDKSEQMVVEPREGILSWAADYDGTVRYGLGVRDEKIIMIARATENAPWQELQNNSLFEDLEFSPMGFGFDNKTLFVKSSLNTGRDTIYEFNLLTGALENKVFDHPRYDVDNLIISPVKRKVVAGSLIEDYPTLHFFDEDYEAMRSRISTALGGARISILDQTPNEQFYILRSYSSNDPGTLYIYDDKEKELSPIWEIMPGLDPDLMSPVKAVTFFSRDGLELSGYVTVPKESSGQNLPTVILVHGGPWARDDMVFDPVVQFLASRGYAVMQINYRGSTGFGDRFEVLGNGEWGGKMQDDISDGVRWLADEGIANPNRVCIVGASYGGYSALMGLAQTPELYQCGIAIAPVTDIKEMMKEAKEGGYDDFYKYSVVQGLKKKDYKKISPVKLADQIEDPVLLIHGEYDLNVPIEHSEEMTKALKKNKKVYEYLIIEEAGHGFIEERHSMIYFKALEDFLAENLGSGY